MAATGPVAHRPVARLHSPAIVSETPADDPQAAGSSSKDAPTSDPIRDGLAGDAINRLIGAVEAAELPKNIGRYQVIEMIGEGGMGIVVKAEQQTPVRRLVAIKIIKLGLDSKSVLARFGAEQQALAMMDHPNIARVLDAGIAENGRAYFVMEFVAGESITAYCDRQQLGIRRRLELFRDVCSAVQHAHTKGIIHRDLKPDNVLVSVKEGQPCVKVIDFGVAKALYGRLAEKTYFTEQGQLIGTPEYMSPEQAEMNNLDIDTRTDIYGLGVMLYELLTGCLPFKAETLRSAAYDEIQRIIREDAPPRPSTRLSRLGNDAATAVALKRRTHLAQLLSQLHGELEWIPLKAMRKDRTERYQTAAELAHDIGNYLSERPLTAGPQSAMYRARKLVLRNKRAAIALAAALVLIVGGIALYVTGIRREQQKTEQARQKADRQRELAVSLGESNAKLAAKNGELAGEKGRLAGRLQRTLSETDQQIGHLLLEQNRDAEALQYEARALEGEANNPAAAADSLALLYRHRRPTAVLRHQSLVTFATFSPDGRRVLTIGDDCCARVWDVASGKSIGKPMQHGNDVMSAAFSPDGTRVVTASADHTAQVWDAATGKPVGDAMRHAMYVLFAAFSPDGRKIATASSDTTARIWDAVTGKPLGEPMRHANQVYSAAFSPDGARIVTASGNEFEGVGEARVWNVASGKPIGDPMKHQSRVSTAAFSPDGTRIVTASWDKTARLWEATTGAPIGKPMAHEGYVFSAEFSPDGTRVVTASADRTARVWNAADGEPLAKAMQHVETVNSASFSPDGTRVITVSGNAARIWDAATAEPIGAPLRHDDGVYAAAFSADGLHVVTASRDKTAAVWLTAATAPLSEPIRHQAGVLSAVFSPDGVRVLTVSADKTARIWSAATQIEIGKPMRDESGILFAVFSPAGNRVVTVSVDGTAQIWDATAGAKTGNAIKRSTRITATRFNHDGARLLIITARSSAQVWDVAGERPIGEPIRPGSALLTAAFSADDRHVITSSADDPAGLWDAATGKPLRDAGAYQGQVSLAVIDGEGSRVATGDGGKIVTLWDAASGKPIGQPMRHEGVVTEIVFSPGGALIATTSSDNTVRMWEAATGKPRGEPMRHKRGVTCAVFSADGSRLITGSIDKNIRLWDTASGKLLGEPLPHGAIVRSVAFSPDGTRAVSTASDLAATVPFTSSDDNTTRLWDIGVPVPDDGEFLARLDQLAGDRRLVPGGRSSPLYNWPDARDALLQEGGQIAATQPSARWMTWFFADPAQRAVSPHSQVMFGEWIADRLDENTPEGMRAVWEADPGNARCMARRARSIIAEIPEPYAAARPIYAELYSRRAMELAPKDPEVLWRRAAILAWLGRRDEAGKFADEKCPAQPPAGDLWAWEAKWEADLLLGRSLDADAAFDGVRQALGRKQSSGAAPIIEDSLLENKVAAEALAQPR
ncbi:MAG TPA: protein kinase [Tepidisphaeraceae bacterium]|jgi:WD40 repeat protein|nr:protein kinase [Tepidisphaeraceae bacterium]